VAIVTEEGDTLNPSSYLDMYGYTCVDELKNTPLHKRYTAKSYADFQLRHEKRLKGESGPSEYEISIIRKDGGIRHVLALRKDIFWNRQKQYQVLYQDITERRKAECKLQETLYTLRKSINTTIQDLASLRKQGIRTRPDINGEWPT
jgi:PAS domain S-box-containing protein